MRLSSALSTSSSLCSSKAERSAARAFSPSASSSLSAPDGSSEADAAACGYALVAPIAGGGTLTLSVATSEGGTRDVPLTLPAAGFGAGKAYDVVLKFTSTQITPQATISPWEEAGDRIEVIL